MRYPILQCLLITQETALLAGMFQAEANEANPAVAQSQHLSIITAY
jgi:hypothetical protein